MKRRGLKFLALGLVCCLSGCSIPSLTLKEKPNLNQWDFSYQCNTSHFSVMSDDKATYLTMPKGQVIKEAWMQTSPQTSWKKADAAQGQPYFRAQGIAPRWAFATAEGQEVHCWKQGQSFADTPVTAYARNYKIEQQIKILEARLEAILQQLGEEL